ncbi:hypothetical protein [Aquamicrobium sp. LC103]|uniref:hypothetical protein n=1 Tax=Aquamicrobium sp. LC103 TaxID=1120658 RepID=UPI0010C9D975|nr:hypothetical protein [Aquamicrobium sp. LC103]TKT76890.1 hypothetical protein XW59_015635 [Aquamicrobium sp. LC103]
MRGFTSTPDLGTKKEHPEENAMISVSYPLLQKENKKGTKNIRDIGLSGFADYQGVRYHGSELIAAC